ncbi:MAG: hypothetical protein AAGB12_08150 [Pseudomonadota bacterium]
MTHEKNVTTRTTSEKENLTSSIKRSANECITDWVNHSYLITCFNFDPSATYHLIEIASLDSDGNQLHHIFSPKNRQNLSEKWFKRQSMTPIDFHRAVRWSFLKEDLFAVFNHSRYTYRLTDKASLLNAILHKSYKEKVTYPAFTNVMDIFSQLRTSHSHQETLASFYWKGGLEKNTLKSRELSRLRPVYRCQVIHEFLQNYASLQSPKARK